MGQSCGHVGEVGVDDSLACVDFVQGLVREAGESIQASGDGRPIAICTEMIQG